MNTKPEPVVWQGSSSQFVNIGAFTLWGLLGLTVFLLPISIAIITWTYLTTKNRKYELTAQRVKTHSGVLSKQTDTEELYRVKDSRLEQPFFLRIFGLGNVILFSTDISSPTLVIEAVPNARALHDQIRNLVEKCRDEKRVRNVEME